MSLSRIVYGSFRWPRSGGYLVYPEKIRLQVCEREEDMSKIPLYLLRYLKIHDDEIVTKI